jgi:hypothetical protein
LDNTGKSRLGIVRLRIKMKRKKNFHNAEPIQPAVTLSGNDLSLALTLIGPLVLSPSNNARGQLMYVFRGRGGEKYASFNSFLAKLRHPLQTVFEDVDANFQI